MPALSPDALDDCFAHDRDRLSHAGALALIDSGARAIVGSEAVSLETAVGRYAACEIAAPRAVPGHDNAAVDGYAVRHEDLTSDAPTSLKLAGRIAAGDRAGAALAAGEAIRIFTGAPVPPGANTIVMQEDVETPDTATLTVPPGIGRGANLRRAGEDVGEGEVLLNAGDRLRPSDVAALASIGVAEVEVFAPLRIAVISSGNEVRRPGSALAPGQVYDANSFLLGALMAACPVKVIDLGIVSDERAAVESRLTEAAGAADLVITTGGASRGEEDHMVKVLAERGQLNAWQIAVKPGRPLGLGAFDGTRVLMLPGNPVAVMVCFLLYAMPLIARLGGGRVREPERFFLPAAFEIEAKKADRREFLRGMVVRDRVPPAVAKFPRDGSGLISSLRAADGLIELAEPVTRVAPGDMVAFLPFSGFGLPTG